MTLAPYFLLTIVMYASQSRTRRHSLEPTPSSRLIKLHKRYSLDQNTSSLVRKRTYEQAFGSNDEEYFDDNDNELFFHPSLEPYMKGGSVTKSTTSLLHFTLKPIGGRRNWKNVVHKQRFEGKRLIVVMSLKMEEWEHKWLRSNRGLLICCSTQQRHKGKTSLPPHRYGNTEWYRLNSGRMSTWVIPK